MKIIEIRCILISGICFYLNSAQMIRCKFGMFIYLEPFRIYAHHKNTAGVPKYVSIEIVNLYSA